MDRSVYWQCAAKIMLCEPTEAVILDLCDTPCPTLISTNFFNHRVPTSINLSAPESKESKILNS